MIRAPRTILSVALFASLTFSAALAADLTATFIDVGQGDSTLFVGPDGTTVLIDGGPAHPDGVRNILSTLDRRGVTKIDTVLITHPHLDHFGGLDQVIAKVPVGQVLYGTRIHASLYDHLEKDIRTHNIPYHHLKIGDKVPMGAGVEATVLFAGAETVNTDLLDKDHLEECPSHPPVAALAPAAPATTLESLQGGMTLADLFLLRTGLVRDRDTEMHLSNGATAIDLNAYSVVVKVSMGSQSILMTGDAPAVVEETLLKSPEQLKSTVLKVGHHGSNHSSSQAFLHAVSPRYCSISVGAGNDYGHPGKETVARLKATGAEVFRTDEAGSLEARTDGEVMTFQPYSQLMLPAPVVHRLETRPMTFEHIYATGQ